MWPAVRHAVADRSLRPQLQIQCGNGIRQVTCFASSSNALFLLFPPKKSLAGSQFQRSNCLARLLPANTSHAVCHVLARWAILWFVFHPRSPTVYFPRDGFAFRRGSVGLTTYSRPACHVCMYVSAIRGI